MWVHEEPVGQELLTDIINRDHENVKYLPGYLLPKNVLAFSSLETICQDSNVLIFALPHQYLETTLNTMKSNLASRNIECLSLIKGQKFHLLILDQTPSSNYPQALNSKQVVQNFIQK
jgi:glycerol-3-phosphate dehydrogenase (NAD+)